ncbi:hypothetical protein EC973_004934 [Apophysomyces ossiformis]|uniref:RRM domain-containing protein n=1 Tax=Apophysomyces ossiformis TaxID=679940 RepID=A0A8H7BUT2_9FUNG|nr:hypothetical protein EC973_004934 [Apophysomyces ossiformis]
MTTRVYIGRLARDARDRDLERLFKGYGDIREINIKSGFGFVEFRDPRDAEDVVYDFHGKEFLGERLIVELARGTRRGREGGGRRDDRGRSHYRLLVENIAPGTTWQALKDLMRKAGEVTFADIIKNRPGEGVVEFAHRSDMEYALNKLDDSDLNGQRVTLRVFECTRITLVAPVADRALARCRAAALLVAVLPGVVRAPSHARVLLLAPLRDLVLDLVQDRHRVLVRLADGPAVLLPTVVVPEKEVAREQDVADRTLGADHDRPLQLAAPAAMPGIKWMDEM